MAKLGLSLNEAKTSVKNARAESFDFLGYTLGPTFARWGGQKYLGASPSRKSVQRIKDKIGDLLKPSEKGSWPSVRDRLNRLLAGWSAYFSYGTRASAYRAVDHHVSESVRRFLAKRHKEPGRGVRRFSWSEIHGKFGVAQLVQPLKPDAVGRP
jgi:RNA-directed DNA polymerase